MSTKFNGSLLISKPTSTYFSRTLQGLGIKNRNPVSIQMHECLSFTKNDLNSQTSVLCSKCISKFHKPGLVANANLEKKSNYDFI